MNIIETLEKEEIARLGKTIPDFAPGDTVIVNVNVVEGERKRVQAYEGVVIAKRNRGLNSSFTVRKISERRRRRAHVPDLLAADRLDRGQAQGRRAPREALLPARPLGQVGAHPREAREPRLAGAQGRVARHSGRASRLPTKRPADGRADQVVRAQRAAPFVGRCALHPACGRFRAFAPQSGGNAREASFWGGCACFRRGAPMAHFSLARLASGMLFHQDSNGITGASPSATRP